MEADNPLAEKRCLLCQNVFKPHPKVKDRQRVCGRGDCQRLRQKLNHLDWLSRNPVDYKLWDRDYGQAWRRDHRDYWQHYRRRKRSEHRAAPQSLASQLLLGALLVTYQRAKKEELSATKSESNTENTRAKKEQLTDDFYLLRGKNLVVWPLDVAKKEQLANCFNYA